MMYYANSTFCAFMESLTIYFVLGCLEMQFVCTKVWEYILNKYAYVLVIDLICKFFDLSKNNDIGNAACDLLTYHTYTPTPAINNWF